jgi:hypothetical protein
MHNEELYSLYSSPRVMNHEVKKDEMGRACSTNEKRDACRLFVGKPRGRNH